MGEHSSVDVPTQAKIGLEWATDLIFSPFSFCPINFKIRKQADFRRPALLHHY
jgi:hypothetical protein